MKQRDACESDQEPTATKRIPWNADNATERGPSSLEVLLMWMLTPGHYERLHSKQRNRAILSILSALRKNGIHHRSESGIRSKVVSIEKQYLSARRWLEERDISSNDVVNGAVNADTEADVLALCPNYCDLFPVLRHSSYLNEMAVREMSTAEEDQDEATDSDSKPKPARSKQKRKLKKDDHRPSKNRRVASYDEVAIHEVNDGC
ncbi:hypothetical protein PR003_g4552 [Phytophthora rubi]|uniref:Uncharacterized protein n=1 Tax=Phytophthora rubi TaxID=129364 RepID=A0A6A4FM05_9STRA|nr:hypothetical protein PR002_g10325 [Phytophthora rubi]KAE9033325.1 hypothetical protein PR001_g10224 [Phytophthora rubi]KAE9352142.1 hypothetical protein PR003_g4552 [Phytophthora rubi]